MTDPKPSVILRAAADLISPLGAWTQGEEARDADDIEVDCAAEDAVCWCALGALALAANNKPGSEAFLSARGFLGEAVGAPTHDDIIEWNDAPDRTQAEVVEALRRAADIAEERGE